jgi:hypothetical protein
MQIRYPEKRYNIEANLHAMDNLIAGLGSVGCNILVYVVSKGRAKWL